MTADAVMDHLCAFMESRALHLQATLTAAMAMDDADALHRCYGAFDELRLLIEWAQEEESRLLEGVVG